MLKGNRAVKPCMLTIFAVVGLAQTTTTVTFKTECISNVCLGDDLAKLGKLNIAWLAEKPQPTHAHSKFERTYPLNPQDLRDVQKGFHGLTDVEYKVLATSVGDPGISDSNIAQFAPTVMHIVLQGTNMALLEKATACNGMPVHGIFKSESGHLTSVLLMSNNGKLALRRNSTGPAF